MFNYFGAQNAPYVYKYGSVVYCSVEYTRTIRYVGYQNTRLRQRDLKMKIIVSPIKSDKNLSTIKIIFPQNYFKQPILDHNAR